MLGPLRTLISVVFLVLFIWGAFSVKLGTMTFADHVDRIGQTPEAQELLDGARSRVRPTLEEAKYRVLGEYVEAPTQLAEPAPVPPAPTREQQPSTRAATLATRTASTDTAKPSANSTAKSSPPRGSSEDRSADRSRSEPRGRAAAVRASTAEAAKLPGRRKRP